MNWLHLIGVALVAIGLVGTFIGIPLAALLLHYDKHLGRNTTRVVELSLFLSVSLGVALVAMASDSDCPCF